MWPHKKIVVTVVAIVIMGVAAGLLFRQKAPTKQVDTGEELERGEDVTVLLDLSASFAPYGQGDRLTLKRVAGAIEELAMKWWKPPVTIVWRRIGTSSLLPRPICDATEFSPRMVDGGKGVEALKKAMSDCLAALNLQNTQTERYTDLSGAIAGAVQSREFSPAKKTIIIFSDFKEDQAPATHPVAFRLKGETLVMVHRPGTDETDMPAYLARIQQWTKRFEESGAGHVLSFPLDLMTHSDLVQSMKPDTQLTGTAATILVDFKDRFNVGNGVDGGDMRYLKTLGKAVAGLADDWTPPVTVRLGVVSSTALHMHWMPSQVFERTMVQATRSNRLNDDQIRSIQDLEIGMDENIGALRRFAVTAKVADLAGAVALAESGSQMEGHANHLFIVSDFVDAAGLPPGLQGSLRGARVVLVYRPASKDGIDESGFMARIEGWRQLFLRSGAKSVCNMEMATLTSRSIRACLGMDTGR